MRTSLFFSVVLFAFGSSNASCPSFITCESTETADSCPPNKFYRERAKVHGCCPGCVALEGEGKNCIVPADCQPGLTCTNQRCVKDPTQACEYYKKSDEIWKNKKYWKPSCNPDGTFAPKQCKGEKMTGKCFCVNKMGERIFGEADWSKAENMTCACSRMVEDRSKKGEKVTLHCDHLGNFEPLQCDRKVCWCANPTSGAPYTPLVPLEMMISLPCHNRNTVGVQYYRQCDSKQHVGELAESLLSNHGTTGISLPRQKCNFDGSYHRVQDVQEMNRCVYVDNSPLTQAVHSKAPNCNCAYDRYVALMNQIDFWADCDLHGNYHKKQFWNGKYYCVDGDGFYYSNDPRDCPINTNFKSDPEKRCKR